MFLDFLSFYFFNLNWICSFIFFSFFLIQAVETEINKDDLHCKNEYTIQEVSLDFILSQNFSFEVFIILNALYFVWIIQIYEGNKCDSIKIWFELIFIVHLINCIINQCLFCNSFVFKIFLSMKK